MGIFIVFPLIAAKQKAVVFCWGFFFFFFFGYKSRVETSHTIGLLVRLFESSHLESSESERVATAPAL